MSALQAVATDHERVAETANTVRALFHVTAEADAGLLSRLLEPVAKTGHMPTRLHASRESGDGSQLVVDLRVGGLERSAAERVGRALRAVIGVTHVISVFELEA